ncbi:MAG TPA: hypothetical protein VIJ79_04065 [Acidobacteriaceae bacterium]
MENGKKIALGVTVLMIAVVGVRVGLIYRANHEEATPAKPAYSESTMTDDDAVTMNLKKQRPDSLKDERALIGKTIWVSAADQMDYFHYANHHADYAHPVGTLMGAEPLIIQDVFEQVAPPKAPVLLRIPAGQRHVLLAFTLPKSADPKAEYAVPVGYYQGGLYTFSTDEIFFYDDPHILYKHWGADAWAHIDKHEVVPGMSENQAMMALGQIIKPSSDSIGDRTVNYDNNSHPVTIVFEKNKAVTVTPDKN